MEKLWAPWRRAYVRKAAKLKGCIFCRAVAPQGKDYLVFRTRHSLCLLNIYPYTNGHLMVAPVRHVKEPWNLRQKEILDLFGAMNTAAGLLRKVAKPHGFNIGMNISRTAGAGVVGHLHIHIVPRWQGDVNFMPVVNDTKVISQSLQEAHQELIRAYAKTKKRLRR